MYIYYILYFLLKMEMLQPAMLVGFWKVEFSIRIWSKFAAQPAFTTSAIQKNGSFLGREIAGYFLGKSRFLENLVCVQFF